MSTRDMLVIDAIVVGDDPEQLSCGLRSCPFYRPADLVGHGGAIDAICTLPAEEGGNILLIAGEGQEQYKCRWTTPSGVVVESTRRVAKCLEALPPQAT